MKKRAHVYYSGNVQGVGFRFTAEKLANSLGVKGWVKNLGDGRVEVLAESEEQTLKKFLHEIEKGLLRYYIHDVDARWEESKDEFLNFDIKF